MNAIHAHRVVTLADFVAGRPWAHCIGSSHVVVVIGTMSSLPARRVSGAFSAVIRPTGADEATAAHVAAASPGLSCGIGA
jgi:hypothetical protein